jgi:hypothetical protein
MTLQAGKIFSKIAVTPENVSDIVGLKSGIAFLNK